MVSVTGPIAWLADTDPPPCRPTSPPDTSSSLSTAPPAQLAATFADAPEVSPTRPPALPACVARSLDSRSTAAVERLAATVPLLRPTRPPADAFVATIFSPGPVPDQQCLTAPSLSPASAPTRAPPRTLAPTTPKSSTSPAAPTTPNSPWSSEPERSMYRFATARPLPSNSPRNLSVAPPSGVQPPESFAPALQSAFTVPDA